MVTVLAIVHVILCIFLVVLVLIQDPKGGASGGMFGAGGGSNSLFGATGAPTFLSRITRWVAVVFAVSCIAMTIFIKPKTDSVLDSISAPAAKSATDAMPELESAAPSAEAPAAEPSNETPTKPQ